MKDKPTVTWCADHSKYYTLIFSDPDAPSRADPKLREVRHWLEQNDKIDVSKIVKTSSRNISNRLSSSTRDLIKMYNLGNPIAGNFYQAQYDDYVPLLHTSFTD